MKWKLGPLLLTVSLTAFGGGEAPESAANETVRPDQRSLSRTMVYDCNGFDFVTRLGPGEMALWLPQRYLVLSQVRSGSGAKYQEGDVIFWSKGNEAMLQLGDVTHHDCRLQPGRVPWEEAFPAAVTVTVNGRVSNGCGRDLEALSN